VTPMTPTISKDIVARFSLLKFFPADPEARATLRHLLEDLCESAEQAIWLCECVLSRWSEWQGPNELRALFCDRLPPKDGISGDSCNSIPHQAPPLRYEVIAGRDRNGNRIEGVRLIEGPQRLALPAPEIVNTELQAECRDLVVHVEKNIKRIPKPAALGVPNKRCQQCFGSGWRADGQLPCPCTYTERIEPAVFPEPAQLEANFSRSRAKVQAALAGLPAKSESDRELEVAMAATPRRTLQETAAELAKLEATLGYRDHKRGGGIYQETVTGAERFLVQ
jgi:hypothetical protein